METELERIQASELRRAEAQASGTPDPKGDRRPNRGAPNAP